MGDVVLTTSYVTSDGGTVPESKGMRGFTVLIVTDVDLGEKSVTRRTLQVPMLFYVRSTHYNGRTPFLPSVGLYNHYSIRFVINTSRGNRISVTLKLIRRIVFFGNL